jgi:hypothetical protein
MSVSLEAVLRAAPPDTINVIIRFRINDTRYGLGLPVAGKMTPGSVDLTRQQICRLLDDCKGYKAVAIVSAGHFVCWEETKRLVKSLRTAVGLPKAGPDRAPLGAVDVCDLLAALNHHGNSRVQLNARPPSQLSNWIFLRGRKDTQRRAEFRVPLPLAPYVRPATFFPDLPHAKLFSVLQEHLMGCVANPRSTSTTMFPPAVVRKLSAEQPALPFLLASLACALTSPMRVGAVVGGVPAAVWRRLLDHYVSAQFLYFCRNEDQFQAVIATLLATSCVTATQLSQSRLDVVAENVDEHDSDEIVMPSQSVLSRRAVTCSLLASTDSGDGSAHASPSLHSSGSQFGRSPSMDAQAWATPSDLIPAPLPIVPFSFRIRRAQRWAVVPSRHMALQLALANGGAHLQLLVGGPGVVVLSREDMLDECVEHFAAAGTSLVSFVEQGRAVKMRIELRQIQTAADAARIAAEIGSARWTHWPESQSALFSFSGTEPGTLFLDHATMKTYARRRVRDAFQRLGRSDRPDLVNADFRAILPRSDCGLSAAEQLFHVPRSVAGRRCYLAQSSHDAETLLRVLPGSRGNTRVMRASSADQVCGVTVETRAVFRSFYYQPVSIPAPALVASGTPGYIYSSPSTTALQHAGLLHEGNALFTISQAGVWAAAEWMAFAERLWATHPMRLRGWFHMAVASINVSLNETVKAHRRRVVAATKSKNAASASAGADGKARRVSIYDMPGVCLATTTNALKMPYAIMPVVSNTVLRHEMGLSPAQAEALLLLRHIPATEATSGYAPWMKVGRALYEVDGGPAMAAGFRVWSRVNGPDSYVDSDHGLDGKRWPGFRPGYSRSTCESSGLHALRKRAVGVDYSSLEVAAALEWFTVQHLALFGEPFPRGSDGAENATNVGETDDDERGIVA